jgi:hypothetical protein
MDIDGDEDEDVGMLPEEGQPRRMYGEIDGQAGQGAAAVQTSATMQAEHMELTLVRTHHPATRVARACCGAWADTLSLAPPTTCAGVRCHPGAPGGAAPRL